MTAVRTTDLNIAAHRRLVYRTFIEAFRQAFDDAYLRDRQFTNLKISQEYPYDKVDYPALVIEYENSLVANAGVGHAEWFRDQQGNLRRWNHNRFEGTLHLTIYALSTLDRDTLADAVVELIRFGKLDTQLIRFFNVIRPSGDQFVALQQIILDSDQLRGSGDSANIAPWQPEDVLVYTAQYSVQIGGGYYNTIERHDWHRITHIIIDAYMDDGYGHIEEKNHDHLDIAWAPPTDEWDGDVIRGRGHVTALEGGPFIFDDGSNATRVISFGHPSGSESFTDL